MLIADEALARNNQTVDKLEGDTKSTSDSSSSSLKKGCESFIVLSSVRGIANQKTEREKSKYSGQITDISALQSVHLPWVSSSRLRLPFPALHQVPC